MIAATRALVIGPAAVLALGLALSSAACTRTNAAPPAATQDAPRAAGAGSSCGGDTDDAFGASAPFVVVKADLRARGASAKLVERLEGSAHRYFRTLGPAFALRTCAAFRDVRWHLPVSALHGDAHVEQVVVTPTTYGLEDFDQSGYGPSVVDLVRYATSLRLACREVPWTCDADEAVSAYFRAYREALDHAVLRKAPSVVARLRRSTPQAPAEWLAWAESLLQPLAPDDEKTKRDGFRAFAADALAATPGRTAAFYDVVRVGSLQMGTGSALETKLLFRIRGPSASPDDDLLVEARSGTPPVGNECAWRPRHGNALMPLLFMSLIGPRVPELYGTAVLDARPGMPEFWLQSWEPGYHELSLADLAEQRELLELANDAGHQLGGHFWTRFPRVILAQQRTAQLRAFDLVEARAVALSRDLAAEVVREWERFRAE